jgi:hypothetical protein
MTSFPSGIQRNFAFLPGCGVSPTSSGCSGTLGRAESGFGFNHGEGDGAADALSIDEGGEVHGVCDGEGEAEDNSLWQGVLSSMSVFSASVEPVAVVAVPGKELGEPWAASS